MPRNESQMLSAMLLISSGREAGTSSTQRLSALSGMRQTSGRLRPRILGERARSLSLEPPQSGQGPCLRKRSTRFMPFSSVTLASAFSTV